MTTLLLSALQIYKCGCCLLVLLLAPPRLLVVARLLVLAAGPCLSYPDANIGLDRHAARRGCKLLRLSELTGAR